MSKQTGVDQYLPWSPKAINEIKTESWKDLLQDALSNSDSQNMWKVIQGLNGGPVAMSQEGRTITDIKSKNNKFINKYVRVSSLSMSQDHQVLNRQFKKRINAPYIERLVLATFCLHFSSHLVFWPSRNYYPYSTHPFHLPLAHASGGLPQSFHY